MKIAQRRLLTREGLKHFSHVKHKVKEFDPKYRNTTMRNA